MKGSDRVSSHGQHKKSYQVSARSFQEKQIPICGYHGLSNPRMFLIVNDHHEYTHRNGECTHDSYISIFKAQYQGFCIARQNAAP